ncbi:MAG: efflux RND transporter periplasmic adaptor subunit [Bacteroidales bacterium]|nr:efflux RND transporter periplasmic adaptor subunit [Bacteroidales bacterium]
MTTIKIFRLLILIVFLMFTACKTEQTKEKEILRPVRYQVLGKTDDTNKRTFSGVAKASEQTELSFRSSGIITKLNAKVGRRVKKGDLIAKLDNVQANLAYEQSISALNTAKSGMNTAKSSLERSKILYERGSASLSDYEAAKNNYQTASDKYESAKRNKDIRQTQINYGFIYAPTNGVIALSNNEINENVSAGQVIAVLNSGQGINVSVGLPENIVNKVELGLKVQVVFSAIENEKFAGSVIQVAPVLDIKASTFPVKIKVLNPIEAIKPGMVAEVTFTFNEQKSEVHKVLTVPVKAVGHDGKGNFVFRIEDEKENVGIVKKKYIHIGKITNRGFIVVDGLDEGDKIAVAGLQTLLDKQKVRLQ